MQAQDGETLGVDAHLQTIGWEGAPATLICLRRQLEGAAADEATTTTQAAEIARLREQVQTLGAAFEGVDEAQAIVSGEGRVERVNAAFAAQFAVSGERCAGRDLDDFFKGEDARRIGAFFVSAARGGAGDGSELGDVRLGESHLRVMLRA